MADWLYRLFGAAPPPTPAPVWSPPRDTSWPDSSQQDMALRSYGDPAAGFVAPSPVEPRPGREGRAPVGPEYSGRVRTLDQPEALQMAFRLRRQNPLDFVPPMPMEPKVQKDVADAYLASQRTALGALGFDPRQMIVGTGKAARTNWTVNGQYVPSNDAMLTTGEHPNTMVHESMHRGAEKLRAAGMMPQIDADEELVVRAMMQRGLGMIERGKSLDREVTRGEAFAGSKQGQKTLDAIEAAAAALIAKNRPMGPR